MREPPRSAGQQFAEIFERITDAFVALDTDWRYTYVNRKAAEILGRAPEDLIGTHIWTEFPEGVGQPFYHAYHKAMAEQVPVQIEEYYPPYDRWFENRIYPSPNGLSIYFQDVSERKRAEEGFREAQRRLTTLIGNLPGVAYRCRNDRDYTVDFISDGVRAMTGYSPADFIERKVSFGGLIHPDDQELVWNSIQMALQENQPYKVVYRFRTVSGEEKWFWEQGMGIVSPSGDLLVLEGFITDISDRKRAEDALREARNDLEAKVDRRTKELSEANLKLKELDRLKSEFLATMSHELRTPLNSVIGFVGMILQGLTGDINPEQRKQLSMVYGSAKHLLALINDILDLSRIESGRMEVVMEDFAVADVIAEVTTSLALSASQKGLLLRIEPEARLAMHSDRRKMFQIVLNLINNAIKFTDRGEVRIACRREGDEVGLVVSDTGIGITKENMAQLFEAFRQIDGTARRRYEGTGLGLYLSRRLARLLGGTITAESEPGKGSRFLVKLPIDARRRISGEEADPGDRGQPPEPVPGEVSA